MKLKMYDYVDVSGRGEEEKKVLVYKFIKDGAPKGEKDILARYVWDYIGWNDGAQNSPYNKPGVFYFDDEDYFPRNKRRKLTYEEAMEEDMSEFKAMKFWIGGDSELGKRVYNALVSAGYRWWCGDYSAYDGFAVGWYTTRSNGTITWWEDEEHPNHHEEINIDWMRKPVKQDVVELNGKKYLKSELEEALKHIKPID